MIRGDKPSGYFETSDGWGVRVQGETRQCTHCQYIWTYQPGSGKTRGLCLSCNGLVCGRPECAAEQRRLTAGTPYNCIPFDKQQEMIRDKIYKEVPGARFEGSKVILPDDLEFSPSGIIIPK